MTSRILSGFIAVVYMIVAYFAGGGEATFKVAIYLVMPLACIWFSDAMGSYTGSAFDGRPAITETTPGCFVAFGGWVLLLLPIIAAIIAQHSGI